jgi:hypothetical protein
MIQLPALVAQASACVLLDLFWICFEFVLDFVYRHNPEKPRIMTSFDLRGLAFFF